MMESPGIHKPGAKPVDHVFQTKDPDENHPISESIGQCTRAFRSIRPFPWSMPEDDLYQNSIRTWGFQKVKAFRSGVAGESDRYTIWAAGPHQDPKDNDTLDNRLKDASHVSKQLLAILDDLLQSLRDAERILKGNLRPWDQDPDGDMAATSDEDDDFDFDTELDQILADIKHTIDCLYRLSGAIADATPHNQLVRVHRFVTAPSKLRSIDDISKMYNKIDERLSSRLGAANSKRRAYFTYRKARYHDLKDSSTDHDNSLTDIDICAVEYAAFRSAVDSMATLLRDEDGSNSKATGDEVLEGADPDVESVQRNFEELALGEEDTQEPDDSRSVWDPILCSFCWTHPRVHGHDWEQHIFDDLQPYVCIESNCPDSQHLFERRHEWIRHVRYTHWMRWECPAGCPMSFATEENLAHHLETQHAELAESHLESLIALGRRPGLGFRELDCPLCLRGLTTEDQYQEHIGRHLERIAVLALPLDEIYASKYQETDSHLRT